MKFRAGHHVVDTQSEGTKRIAFVWPDKELYRRKDNKYFYVNKGKAKLVDESAAFRYFWKINHKVHNFNYLFKEVFFREFSLSLISKKKTKRGKSNENLR